MPDFAAAPPRPSREVRSGRFCCCRGCPAALALALRPSVACLAPFILLASVGALGVGLETGLALAASALGGVVAAAAVHLLVRRSPRSTSRDRRTLRTRRSIGGRGRRAHTRVLVTWAHLRRSAAGVPVYVLVAGCFALAGGAGVIARHNANSDVASTAIFMLSVPALQLLAQADARLVQLLGHELHQCLTRLLEGQPCWVSSGSASPALPSPPLLRASVSTGRRRWRWWVAWAWRSTWTYGVLHALIRAAARVAARLRRRFELRGEMSPCRSSRPGPRYGRSFGCRCWCGRPGGADGCRSSHRRQGAVDLARRRDRHPGYQLRGSRSAPGSACSGRTAAARRRR